MRFFLTSILLAAVFLVPPLAARLEFDFPGLGLLKIPATGLDYMAVFFHELGHTLTYWAFGYPAIPSFDFEYGGGMTYDFERPEGAVFAVWALMAGLAAWLATQKAWGLLAALGVVAVVHAALAFNDGHRVLAGYMGHGAEILIACFCILRAVLNQTHYGATERYLNMIFGLFVIGRNALLAFDLWLSDVGRIVYGMQKGGHMQGDMDRIAEMLGVQVQSVGIFSLLLMAVLFAALAVLVMWEKKGEGG